MCIAVHSCNPSTSLLTLHLTMGKYSASCSTFNPCSADPAAPLHHSKHHSAAARTSPLWGKWLTMQFHTAFSMLGTLLRPSDAVLSLYSWQSQESVSGLRVFQFPNSSSLCSYHQTSQFRLMSIWPWCCPYMNGVYLFYSEILSMKLQFKSNSSFQYSSQVYNLLYYNCCAESLYQSTLTDSC